VKLKEEIAWIHAQSKGKKAIAVPLNKDAIDLLKRQIGKHPTRVFSYPEAGISDQHKCRHPHCLSTDFSRDVSALQGPNASCGTITDIGTTTLLQAGARSQDLQWRSTQAASAADAHPSAGAGILRLPRIAQR